MSQEQQIAAVISAAVSDAIAKMLSGQSATNGNPPAVEQPASIDPPATKRRGRNRVKPATIDSPAAVEQPANQLSGGVASSSNRTAIRPQGIAALFGACADADNSYGKVTITETANGKTTSREATRYLRDETRVFLQTALATKLAGCEMVIRMRDGGEVSAPVSFGLSKAGNLQLSMSKMEFPLFDDSGSFTCQVKSGGWYASIQSFVKMPKHRNG